MPKRIPFPEQAPAASWRSGKTVMSWHWSVRLDFWVSSPWSPPLHSPARTPVSGSAKTAGESTMRASEGRSTGISMTSMRNSAVRSSPGDSS